MTEVFTVAQLAERWSCHKDTVFEMVRSGTIKAFKVGREWRITAATVERYENGD